MLCVVWPGLNNQPRICGLQHCGFFILLHMKKSIFILVSISLAVLVLSALRPANVGTPTADAMRAKYAVGLDAYAQALAQLEAELALPASGSDAWKARYREVRTAYKRVEFLLAYLDEDNNRDFLNGPPLPWIDRVIAELEVVQPMGMQILEEHLYGEEAEASKGEIARLTKTLVQHFVPIRKVQLQLPFTDRQILESVRAGLFRVTAMGLTGFDTPGSGATLTESAISLRAMQEATTPYFKYLKPERQGLADSIGRHFDGAVRALEAHPDFDAFDRLHFIRTYMEPLYGEVLRLHMALGIETVYQVETRPMPLNYLSANMFSAAALNDHYYAGIGLPQEPAAVVELGRMLFFDPVLSSNNERACASCHRPELAFTDGLPKSEAMDHQGNVGRNAPTLINSVFADKYFYDFRTNRLETQAEHVIFNPKEFNTTYYDILDKLNTSKGYVQSFRQAYGKAPDLQGITRALAAYVRSLKGFNSPVDQYLRGEDVALAPEVQLGFNLFMGKALCGTCHFAPTFSGLVPPSFRENESEVIGVPLNPQAGLLEIDADLGRYENGIPRDRADHLKYSFKTTTVRNAALTAPYMHNGVYKTLEEVVDFYNRGGGAGMGIDLPYQTLPFDHLNLSAAEQRALVVFMQALTDTTSLTTKPVHLPAFDAQPGLNKRTVGGNY